MRRAHRNQSSVYDFRAMVRMAHPTVDLVCFAVELRKTCCNDEFTVKVCIFSLRQCHSGRCLSNARVYRCKQTRPVWPPVVTAMSSPTRRPAILSTRATAMEAISVLPETATRQSLKYAPAAACFRSHILVYDQGLPKTATGKIKKQLAQSIASPHFSPGSREQAQDSCS